MSAKESGRGSGGNRRGRNNRRTRRNKKKNENEETQQKQKQYQQKKNVSRQNFSGNKSNYRNLCKDPSCGHVHFDGKKISVHYARKHIRDSSARQWASKMRQQLEKLISQNTQLVFLPVHVSLQENHLQSSGVGHFVEALTHERLQIDSLKLFKNQINDEGAMHVAQLISETTYPVTEIHLSHNVITKVSAEAIFLALKRENKPKQYQYPCLPISAPSYITKPVPIWLRLEQNFIDLDHIAPFIMNNGFQVCHAESHKEKGRAVCGPRICKYDWEKILTPGQCPVHLFMFHLQYKPECLEDKIEGLRAMEPASSKEDKGSGPGPLIMFADTSAVFYLANSSHCLSFSNLTEKASKGEFGWHLEESQRANISILFTVNRELDGLKSNENFRPKIQALHKQVFPQGEESGILELLDFTSEAQLKRDGKMNSSVNNDFSILQQVKKYSELFGGSEISGNVLLLTGDRSQITLARKMNIPVLQTDQLSRFLDKNKNNSWNSELIWKFACSQEKVKYTAMKKHVGQANMIKYYPKVLNSLEKVLALLSEEQKLEMEENLPLDLWRECMAPSDVDQTEI